MEQAYIAEAGPATKRPRSRTPAVHEAAEVQAVVPKHFLNGKGKGKGHAVEAEVQAADVARPSLKGKSKARAVDADNE